METDGAGVAVIDLSRIRGGTEHWRVCRGLQGSFDTTGPFFVPRPGTAAGPDGRRGDVESLAVPDYAGLACMDDISTAAAPSAWQGTWTSRIEPAVHLDLYQIGVNPSTELMNARSTAMMGTPEESAYVFRTLLWRRNPLNERDTTRVDLVMEPRVGAATLAGLSAIAAVQGDPYATGVALSTRNGKRITVYWSPEGREDAETGFADGTTMTGPLAAVVDDRIMTTGVSRVVRNGTTYTTRGVKTGRITALSRMERTIETEGLDGISAGDRILINPDGRGHNYGVERAETLPDGRLRLTLDVVSVLGRANVLSYDEDVVELGTTIMARTGNLDGTRLLSETTELWAEIEEAGNTEPEHTTIRLKPGKRTVQFVPGDAVCVVDYVEGDTVRFEPTEEA